MKKQILSCIAVMALGVGILSAQDLKTSFIDHMYYLAGDELAGREPNTKGDTLASTYIRDFFASLPGVELLGEEGFQKFSYTAYRKLSDEGNSLKVGERTLRLGKDFIPSLTSATGTFTGEVVSVGEGKEYDYQGKDVKGKFVLVQLAPRSYTDASEQRNREMWAIKQGAAGIIMSGQPLKNLPARWPSGDIAVFKVTPSVARTLAGKTVTAQMSVDMLTEHTQNIVVKISAPKENNPNGESIVLGGHYDHMGRGEYQGVDTIYYGADDNASGTIGVMELARWVSDRRAFLKRDVICIAFGAEERGLKGSKHYVANPIEPLENIKGMINIDMMGRMNAKGLSIRGVGTAYEGPTLFNSLPNPELLDMAWEFRGTGPTDYTPFYQAGIPAFSFGTRTHADYHTPGDRADRINYDGMVSTFNYITNLVSRLAFEGAQLTFKKTE